MVIIYSGNINLIIGPSLPEGLENKEQKVGEMGTIMVIAGSTASIFAGCILDAVKKFKVVSLACYGITLIMYIVWTYILQQGNLILDFIIAGLLGFFMTGYLPIGFEFASEISWPESEATSSGFLNLAAMLVGAILTPITEKVINSAGVRSANIGNCQNQPLYGVEVKWTVVGESGRSRMTLPPDSIHAVYDHEVSFGVIQMARVSVLGAV